MLGSDSEMVVATNGTTGHHLIGLMTGGDGNSCHELCPSRRVAHHDTARQDMFDHLVHCA